MKIVWTRLALADLDDAYNYIAATNPGAAVDTIDRIEKAVSALKIYPEIGRLGRISDTRELVVTRTPFIYSAISSTGRSGCDFSCNSCC